MKKIRGNKELFFKLGFFYHTGSKKRADKGKPLPALSN
jgi:hypothetical protein